MGPLIGRCDSNRHQQTEPNGSSTSKSSTVLASGISGAQALQIRIRFQAVGEHGGDKAVERRGGLCTPHRVTEHPVAPAANKGSFRTPRSTEKSTPDEYPLHSTRKSPTSNSYGAARLPATTSPCSLARYARMRLAFAPASPKPSRDSERTSIRLPCPNGITRITTSSLNPK